MEERSALRLAELAHLLDSERIVERAMVRVAYHSAEFEDKRLGQWLVEQIDRAIHDILEADRRAAALESPGLDDDDPNHSFLILEFSVPPAETLAASVRYNDLPLHYRRPFYELICKKRPLDECLAEPEFESLEQMAYRACYSLEILMFGDVEVALRHPYASEEPQP